MDKIDETLRLRMREVQAALASTKVFIASLASLRKDLSSGGGLHPPVPPIKIQQAERLVGASKELTDSARTLQMKCVALRAAIPKKGVGRPG